MFRKLFKKRQKALLVQPGNPPLKSVKEKNFDIFFFFYNNLHPTKGGGGLRGS